MERTTDKWGKINMDGIKLFKLYKASFMAKRGSPVSTPMTSMRLTSKWERLMKLLHLLNRSVESEEENWSPMISQLLQRRSKEDESDNPDFLYVSEVLQAIHRQLDTITTKEN